MLAKIISCGIAGLEASPVTIEVDVSRGLPYTIIVGLPDNAVKESKERIRAAIKNSTYQFPMDRITVNLAPADTKKEGGYFDLAIALGILAASGQIEASLFKRLIVVGELALDGHLRAMKGTLSIASHAARHDYRGIILPRKNADEATLLENLRVYPVDTLKEAVDLLHHLEDIPFYRSSSSLAQESPTTYEVDFSEVKGQFHAKRGLEVAAAGGHNILLIGPPGSGKTMLAKRLPSILPDMTRQEALEVTKIYSVLGMIPYAKGLLKTRPFRSPHHTTSDVALIGGGSQPKPGEVTLANHGVLFLDELPEFHRNVLEALRQPLEERSVMVARAARSLRFPAQFMLVAAMNPCPCGWFSDSRRACQCSAYQIQKYLARISGPLLDRIDIQLEVPSLSPPELLSSATTETSAQMKERTSRSRRIQQKRFADTSILTNAQMNLRQLKKFCPLNEEGRLLLRAAIEELCLSARAYDKILRLARTIADLEDSCDIKPAHLSEAIQYRSLDRNWWG